MDFLMQNPVTGTLLTAIVYAFYCIVYGLALVGPLLFLRYVALPVLSWGVLGWLLFSVLAVAAGFLFCLCCVVTVGITERLLMFGIKPGTYSVGSPVMIRWIINGGLHTIMVCTALPILMGTPFIKLFFTLCGCRVGKNVFINTRDLHDSFLLTLEDNVILGGGSTITCHIFEGGRLYLGAVRIGEGSLVGSQAYIMPGVNVGKGCGVGVCSYVRKNKSIPDGEVYMTMPSIPLRHLSRLMGMASRNDRQNKGGTQDE